MSLIVAPPTSGLPDVKVSVVDDREEDLDLATVVKMSQALSGEIVLEKLLARLLVLALEHAGAGRGLLVMLAGRDPYVAEAVARGGPAQVELRRSPLARTDRPESLFDHVIRSHDCVIIDDVTKPNPFAVDGYLKGGRARSVLCVPLVRQGTLIGVLYLENDLVPHAFTGERTAALRLLASQAAISLENARLFGELERARLNLTEAQRLSRTGSFDWNATQGTVTWSEELYAIFGVDRATELSTDLVLAFAHPADRERLRAVIERVAGAPEDWSIDHRIVSGDGSIKHLQVAARLIPRAPGEVVYVGAVRDATRERLADEMRRAEELAEAANRARDRFVANVSHEIRTPMNAIIGLTELTLDSPLSDDQRRSLTTVKSAADSLLGVIDDLLDFAKIEEGKMDLVATTFSLHTVVHDSLQALALRAHGKGLELLADVAPDVPAEVVGDPVRLRQVIVNLVENAIKFTSRGEIVVAVDVAADGRVRFAVRDSGIGIAPDKHALIFGAFEQGDPSLARRQGGTGLGLHIAAHLVGLMGGKLAVASEPGRGSTFTFAVELAGRGGADVPKPIVPDEVLGAVVAAVDRGGGVAPRPAARAAGRPRPRLRILVAEDNELNVNLMRQLLGKRGHDVSIAVDGREALALHESSSFDVLLLDIHLPHIDGLGVICEIRRREGAGGRHLHVIATTAVGRREDRAACFAAGVDDFLSKPISSARLWRALGRVVPADRSGAGLVDPVVLLAACDGDESILQTIVLALQSSLPDRVRAVAAAFAARDLGQVSRAAHKLGGLVCSFSTVVGQVALELEERAGRGERDAELAPLVDRLAALAPDLVRQVGALSAERLRSMAPP